jgi:hypothetical protein
MRPEVLRTFIAPTSERMDDTEEELLLRVHNSSGSTLTTNSRRLRTLRNNPVAKARCREDVKVHQYIPLSLVTDERFSGLGFREL